MAENSKIEWTDHTFNPWIGCTKVSPGCAHCYAETRSKRTDGVVWGKGQPRQRTSEGNWKLPLKWNRLAASCGQHEGASECPICSGPQGPRRPRVFCASLADWLDDEVPIEWLRDLLVLIQETPHLDWLLLTKRPENFHARIQAVADGWQSSCKLAVWWSRGVFPENIWLGTTVEDQARADQRMPLLIKIPAKVRFLSCEPLLGPVNLNLILRRYSMISPCYISWVIAGGESGPGARPMHPLWVRSLRDQCEEANVRFLFKQWGEWFPITPLYEGRDEDAEDGGNVDRQGCLTYSGHIWNFEREGQPSCDRAWIIERMGKKAAGRLLDGIEHTEFPQS